MARAVHFILWTSVLTEKMHYRDFAINCVVDTLVVLLAYARFSLSFDRYCCVFTELLNSQAPVFRPLKPTVTGTTDP